jgi:hypothetical protein
MVFPICAITCIAFFPVARICKRKKLLISSIGWRVLTITSVLTHGYGARCSVWVSRMDKTLAHIVPIIHLQSVRYPVVGIVGVGYSVTTYYYNIWFTTNYSIKMSSSKAHASIHLVGATCAYISTVNQFRKK